jgi:hypothetical protein
MEPIEIVLLVIFGGSSVLTALVCIKEALYNIRSMTGGSDERPKFTTGVSSTKARKVQPKTEARRNIHEDHDSTPGGYLE